MFNPLENEELDDWFQRLNAPLKRLPTNERTEIHQEVRQHLEALAAANEELGSSPHEAAELALTQFGDPGKFGRQMQREALTLPRDPNLWHKNSLLAASVYAFVQSAGALMGVTALMLAITGVSLLIAPGLPERDPWNLALSQCYLGAIAAVPVWAGWITGCRMKRDAAKGMLFGLLALAGPVLGIGICCHDFKFVLTVIGSLSAGCAAAYLASVTKRGWHKPTWKDFKVTLSKRRVAG